MTTSTWWWVIGPRLRKEKVCECLLLKGFVPAVVFTLTFCLFVLYFLWCFGCLSFFFSFFSSPSPHTIVVFIPAFVSLSYPYFDTGLILVRRVDNSKESSYAQNISEALLRVWAPFKHEVWLVIVFAYLPLMALAFYWFERESNPVFTSSPNASF